MDTRQEAYVSTPRYFEALFDWAPDLARFEREVDEASGKGIGDGLTLAEMECSIDLIDTELLAWRGHHPQSEDIRRSIADLVALRGKLARLVDRLRPLVPEY